MGMERLLYGKRLLDAEVYKFLEETTRETEEHKKWQKSSVATATMILYQLKFWQDCKGSDWFHKSYCELQEDFPWLSERSIKNYLDFLCNLQCIDREQGRFKFNSQKWSYKLNFSHPVVIRMYVLESLLVYVDKNKQGHKSNPICRS